MQIVRERFRKFLKLFSFSSGHNDFSSNSGFGLKFISKIKVAFCQELGVA